MKTEERPVPSTRTETVYICEEPKCEFETRSRHDADSHAWYQHTQNRTESLNLSVEPKLRDTSIPARHFNPNLHWYKIGSKEDFDVFCKAKDVETPNATWDGPGWYEWWTEEFFDRELEEDVPTEYLRPASHTGVWLEKLRKNVGDALAKLRKHGVLATAKKKNKKKT